MQVDDGAKAAPETILNAGEDWLTIIEGSLHVIPQDHWGIGATIKVRLDGDNLIISADEPGYSESTSVRIPALTDRAVPEPDDAIEAAAKAMFRSINPVWGSEIPDEVIPEGVDPDDLYHLEITWEQWVKYGYGLDYDSLHDMESETFLRMARAALQAAIGLHGDETGAHEMNDKESE